MGAFKGDEGASVGAMLAFLVAIVILLASVGSLMYVTRTTPSTQFGESQQSARTNGDARSVAALVIGSPGRGLQGADWLPDNATQTPLCTGFNCADSADAVSTGGRLGLGEAAGSDPSFLSFRKLENLRVAPFAANASDGYVNYEEAAKALGVTAGHGFHIRAYPTLESTAQVVKKGDRDPNLRTTYIGDIDVYNTVGTPPPANPTDGLVVGTTTTCYVAPIGTPGSNPQSVRIGVNVTNGGTTPTQFHAVFHFSHVGSNAGGTQDPADHYGNTWLVQPGQTVFLYDDVPDTKKFGGCDGNSRVTVTISDIGTTTLGQNDSPSHSVPSGTSDSAPADMWMQTNRPYFVNPSNVTWTATSGTPPCQQPISLTYTGSNPGGGGNGANGNGNGQPFKGSWFYLKITNQAGTSVYTKEFQHTSNTPSGTVPSPGICLPAGGYTGTLWFCNQSTSCASSLATKESVDQKILVTLSTLAPYSPPSQPPPVGPDQFILKAPALTEVSFLNTLVQNFCPYIFDNATVAAMASPPAYATRCGSSTTPASVAAREAGIGQVGDVIPDSSTYLNNELPRRLATNPDTCTSESTARYDITNVLVAGSNMSQTAMSSPATRACVGNWVAHGGLLVVLGSDTQNAAWLSDILDSAIVSSNGGLGTPDPGHPLLHVPNPLLYSSYDSHGQVWTFVGPQAAQQASYFTDVVVRGSDPVTGISDAGTLGSGTVELTTWRAYDPFNGSRPALAYSEGLALMGNLLSQSYRDLFLDYGPPLPTSTNVIPDVRHMQVQDPDFANPIPITIVVYAW